MSMPSSLLKFKHTVETLDLVIFYKIQAGKYRFHVSIDKEEENVFHFMSIYEDGEHIFAGSSQNEADIWNTIEEFIHRKDLIC